MLGAIIYIVLVVQNAVPARAADDWKNAFLTPSEILPKISQMEYAITRWFIWKMFLVTLSNN